MGGANSAMDRRRFLHAACVATAAVVIDSSSSRAARKNGPVRLGGPVFAKYDSPESWVKALKDLGYRAAYCPVGVSASDDEVAGYARAAAEADITIAEVGAWSNPISPDKKMRADALAKCRKALELAERIGARCCVNISGSRGKDWDGHDPANFTRETFDMIVETTRSIIDAVKPTRTFFALEMMPWGYPDSPDSYLDLIKAVDRDRLGVHLDPVNIICSPRRYYSNADVIRECFEKLGPHLRSCHAKDIIMSQKLTTHLDETRPGQGNLDYAAYLRQLSHYCDSPLMLEHLPDAAQYKLAADHIRSIAKTAGVSLG